MTLRSLRALARRILGAGAARLTTKAALVRALAGRAGGVKAQMLAPGGTRKTAPTRAAARGKAASKAPPRKAPAKKAPAKKAPAKKAPAKKAPPKKAVAAKAPAKARVERAAPRASPPSGGGPAAPARNARRPSGGAAGTAGDGEGAMDPAGFFVARVRGEEAVREAPHPMAARSSSATAGRAAAPRDEQLGELPASYGEDTLVVLPRDPTSLFVYWDQSELTLDRTFGGLDRPRVQLWLWARAGDGWERLRTVDLALEARSWYLHGLEPGRSYRAELRVVDAAGRERAIGPGSGLAGLPPAGPSPIVDDRFVRLPWDQPLGPPLGPGHRGEDFPAAAREALAHRSSWGEGAARPASGRPASPGGGGEP